MQLKMGFLAGLTKRSTQKTRSFLLARFVGNADQIAYEDYLVSRVKRTVSNFQRELLLGTVMYKHNALRNRKSVARIRVNDSTKRTTNLCLNYK